MQTLYINTAELTPEEVKLIKKIVKDSTITNEFKQAAAENAAREFRAAEEWLGERLEAYDSASDFSLLSYWPVEHIVKLAEALKTDVPENPFGPRRYERALDREFAQYAVSNGLIDEKTLKMCRRPSVWTRFRRYMARYHGRPLA